MRPVPRISTVCPTCQITFQSLACQQKRYCSRTCARKGNWSDPRYAAHMSAAHVGQESSMRGKTHRPESIERMRRAKFRGNDRKLLASGYVAIYSPGHPKSRGNGRILEHIAVMERALGRYLQPGEVVHHINRDRSDNRLENLQLMDTKEHALLHARERGLGTIVKPPAAPRDQASGQFVRVYAEKSIAAGAA